MPESNDIQTVANTSAANYNLKPAGLVKKPYKSFRPQGLKWVKAAHALSQGLTHPEAAQIAGVTVAAVHRWCRLPEFQAILQRYVERIDREAVSVGVARKSARLLKLNRHAGRIERVFDARAEALKDLVPGGDSGLISHDQKSIGAGLNAEIIDVYEFDAALSREYRGVLEQAAKEIGGQFDQGAGSTAGGVMVPITINFPVMAKEQLEAVNSAPTIDLPPMARRLLQRPSDGQQR